jgi:glutathione peroxidase-family protein
MLVLALTRPCATQGAKFIIDKNGNVVDRNGDSPMASEAKIKSLL